MRIANACRNWASVAAIANVPLVIADKGEWVPA
jgi:hypothetical protein